MIDILESWLMDAEQKQNLSSNVWDIFFLYAACSMLDLLSMDRNRLLWKKDQMAQIKKRVLMGLVTIVNHMLETSGRQSPPENIRRNIFQKMGSFFDFNDVDDSIFDSLNNEICLMIEDQFRRFIRINHSRFDLLHKLQGTDSDLHGYLYLWRQRVIDAYKEKGAGKVRRA